MAIKQRTNCKRLDAAIQNRRLTRQPGAVAFGVIGDLQSRY